MIKMKRDEVVTILNGLLKEDKIKILHISLSTRRFYNGVVLSIGEEEEGLSFNDMKLGYITIPFSLIINIESKREKKDG